MSESRNDLIRHRAYLLWEANGAIDGDDWNYWLQAEAEILAEDANGASTAETAAPLSAPTAAPSSPPVKAAKASPRAASKAPRKPTVSKATAKPAASKAPSRKKSPLVTEPTDG
jgi:hypothetical protein